MTHFPLTEISGSSERKPFLPIQYIIDHYHNGALDQLDDHAYFTACSVADWGSLENVERFCSWHNSTASQCSVKCDALVFSPISMRVVEIQLKLF